MVYVYYGALTLLLYWSIKKISEALEDRFDRKSGEKKVITLIMN